MNTATPPARRTSSRVATALLRRAFTIVEVIVVIVLVAILSGIVVPRLLNTGSREAEQEAKAVRMLLTTLAQRDAISGRAMAVEFDSATSTLSLLVRQTTAEDESTLDAAPTALVGTGWKVAQMVRPIILNASSVQQVTSDGRAVGAGDAPGAASAGAGTGPNSWRIEVRPSEPRPAISILLGASTTNTDGRAWQIDLLPGQTAATLKGLESSSQWRAPEPESLDLDATGMREASW